MAQLCQHEDEFKRLNTEVVVISFGTPTLARTWLEETCAPFTMLLDQERAVYRAYGLRRSWNVKTAWAYGWLLLRGRKLGDIQEDPNQLGGDFIVDAKGIVRLTYPSRDAADRPSVSDLLGVLRQLDKERHRAEKEP